MKKLLVLKGMPEEEVKRLIDEREKVLEEVKKEKEAGLTQDLTVTLQKLKDGKISIDEALAKVKGALKKPKRSK